MARASPPSARPDSANRLGFPNPIQPVPEHWPGKVSVLADAHILGHGDDAVQRSNHDSSSDHLGSLYAVLPPSLARNCSRPALLPTCESEATPSTSLASYLNIRGPASTRSDSASTRPAPPSRGVRARRRGVVQPRAPGGLALLHPAMPRTKSASSGHSSAAQAPRRQAVLSRFFQSSGSLRSTASPTEPAEKVEDDSSAPPASTAPPWLRLPGVSSVLNGAGPGGGRGQTGRGGVSVGWERARGCRARKWR